jgi:voltage-gated potassium channel
MESSNRNKLKFAGINTIVYPQELVGLITKELIGQPVAFEIIHELRSEKSNVHIAEIAVTPRILESFSTVGELGNQDFRVVLLGIHKKETQRFYFNPLDDTFIENGDFLLVIGYRVFVKEFEKHLHTKVKYDEN